MNTKKGLRIQSAVSLLVVVSVVTSIIINWYTATNALKNSLTEEYLDNNYNYAKKLSLNTHELLDLMQRNLIAAAKVAGTSKMTQGSLDTWNSANGMDFNSIFITDTDGVIQVISPSVVQYKNGVKVQQGMKIESDAMKQALSMREPFFSKPYRATSGQLIMLLSAPIFDRTGDYKGLMCGTIYLQSHSALKRILENHVYENGSYVYVVDSTGRIIYNPDDRKINKIETNKSIIEQIRQGKSSKTRTTNSQGIEYFMGYAVEKSTGWGIVSQTPVSVLQEPLHKLLKEMVIQSLPLLIIILLIAGILTHRLTKPLSDLAKYSKDAITQEKMAPIENLRIHSNIYEVRELYHHIKNHIILLNRQIQIDGLTGIANRKTFDSVIMEYLESKTPFSLIMLDIDGFKCVNDTYGHVLGDEVLKDLSKILEGFCREDDLCFRYGGEEFGILVKDKQEADAFKMAERLRIKIAETNSPTGKPITVSLGITSLQPEDQHPKIIIERADTALYQSKSAGGNRTTIYSQENQLQSV